MNKISNIDDKNPIQEFKGTENGNIGKDMAKEIAIGYTQIKRKEN